MRDLTAKGAKDAEGAKKEKRLAANKREGHEYERQEEVAADLRRKAQINQKRWANSNWPEEQSAVSTQQSARTRPGDLTAKDAKGAKEERGSRASYFFGLGSWFRANSSNQRMASIRDSKRWTNRKSSIFLNKSLSKRSSICSGGFLAAIAEQYTRYP